MSRFKEKALKTLLIRLSIFFPPVFGEWVNECVCVMHMKMRNEWVELWMRLIRFAAVETFFTFFVRRRFYYFPSIVSTATFSGARMYVRMYICRYTHTRRRMCERDIVGKLWGKSHSEKIAPSAEKTNRSWSIDSSYENTTRNVKIIMIDDEKNSFRVRQPMKAASEMNDSRCLHAVCCFSLSLSLKTAAAAAGRKLFLVYGEICCVVFPNERKLFLAFLAKKSSYVHMYVWTRTHACIRTYVRTHAYVRKTSCVWVWIRSAFFPRAAGWRRSSSSHWGWTLDRCLLSLALGLLASSKCVCVLCVCVCVCVHGAAIRRTERRRNGEKRGGKERKKVFPIHKLLLLWSWTASSSSSVCWIASLARQSSLLVCRIYAQFISLLLTVL